MTFEDKGMEETRFMKAGAGARDGAIGQGDDKRVVVTVTVGGDHDGRRRDTADMRPARLRGRRGRALARDLRR
ncbi:hypothetical protein FAZ69_21215 [Trinickia terrae]|uniref:Uncharacterized protein n=1 Tax=Trinickia terrae TaxID=2571161 RepID=A0A4U1HZ13_9BURK|nr:hypothetical protein [Trinickia terrae]TKC86363.1 hypothetical protein FAZ69_21215 [Trinickia terrae]